MVSIFNSDHINRKNMVFPCDAMFSALVNAIELANENKLPQGQPSNISHDITRVIGWVNSFGIILNDKHAFHIGDIIFAETEEEHKQINKLAKTYFDIIEKIELSNFELELNALAATLNLEDYSTGYKGAAFIESNNVAINWLKTKHKSIFDKKDKDNLIPISSLLEKFDYLGNGVLKHKTEKISIFVDRGFRRSHYIYNNFNNDFLDSLFSLSNIKLIEKLSIKIDFNLIALSSSIIKAIELDYWYGPKFNDDISSIGIGATEHVASDKDKFFHNISKTQFVVKDVEDRNSFKIRTFECEELTETKNISDSFYTKYCHAEFDITENTNQKVIHFDGALKNYTDATYSVRKNKSLIHAGKTSQYNKLFRIDGNIGIEQWKTLLTKYFRGNYLVKEYLGNDIIDESLDDEQLNKERMFSLPLAFIGVFEKSIKQVLFNNYFKFYHGGKEHNLIEIANEDVKALYLDEYDFDSLGFFRFENGMLNLAPIFLGIGNDANINLRSKLTTLKKLIINPLKDFKKICITFAWEFNDILYTITTISLLKDIADIYNAVAGSINFNISPKEWIKTFCQNFNSVKCKNTGEYRIADLFQNSCYPKLPNQHGKFYGVLPNVKNPPTP